jgi:archaeosine synthase
LGLVPRELELAYPAQQYDIPVTGVWDTAEKAMIEHDLKWLVENNHYDNIIVHLSGELLGIVEHLFQTLNIDIIKTCKGSHPTSQNALKNLTKNLTEVAQELDRVPQQERLREYMLNRLKFQFSEIGAKLLENGEIMIKGKYPNLKLFRDKNQLGMLIAERGMTSLTLEGAKVLAEGRSFWVEIDDFQPKGSVMAVGVVEADPAIRIEDEVVITHKDELRGVGKAAMSVPEMLKSVRGIAVKVRHHT